MIKVVIIYTENDDLNEELERNIEGSRIAFYTKYLIEEREADTVIISVQENKFEFEKFIFELRKRNIRIILLLESADARETEIAIRLGIYDLLFGTFSIDEVLRLVNNPNHFSNIAEIYKRIYKIEEEEN